MKYSDYVEKFNSLSYPDYYEVFISGYIKDDNRKIDIIHDDVMGKINYLIRDNDGWFLYNDEEEEGVNKFYYCANLNDVFYYASADGEYIKPIDIHLYSLLPEDLRLVFISKYYRGNAVPLSFKERKIDINELTKELEEWEQEFQELIEHPDTKIYFPKKETTQQKENN